MELLNLYYVVSLPLITCNIFFYSVSSLSNSITSTQNVFRFIYEHKDNDYLIYKNEIKNIDLSHKLRIIKSLIFDTIKKYISNKDDYDKFIDIINNPLIENDINEYSIIDIKYNSDIFSLIDEPIAYSIIFISEILNNINNIINKIKNKIIEHKKLYFKNFVSLSINKEISELKYQNHILDVRYNMFIELLKIYLPLNKNNS
jgi:hypothetical protein